MDTFPLAALILGISALASVFNARVLRLPETIGLMATGLIASVVILLLGVVFPSVFMPLCDRVAEFNFSAFVLEYALGFLIFAGAFSADSRAMKKDRWPILVFATFGIVISTFIVGVLAFGITVLLGLGTPFIHCLLFGALISPADPIAVLAILKDSTVPRSLQADIAGESLLNDGVAVVVFLTILQIAGGGGEVEAAHGGVLGSVSIGSVSVLLVREIFGGVALGIFFGWAGMSLVNAYAYLLDRYPRPTRLRRTPIALYQAAVWEASKYHRPPHLERAPRRDLDCPCTLAAERVFR